MLRYFLRVLIHYLLFFVFWRGVFLLLFYRTGSVAEALPAFVHGARMDLSLIGYIAVPLWLAAIFQVFRPARIMPRLLSGYHRFVLLLFTLILTGNLVIFHFWGTLLNYRALTYLTDPVEALASLSILQRIMLLPAIALLVWITWRLMKKVRQPFPAPVTRDRQTWTALAAVPLVVFLCIRGGLQKLPMNESLVYFSDDALLNQAAVNPVWHLAYDSKMATDESHHPFRTLDDRQAQQLVEAARPIHHRSDTTLLDYSRPNLVFLILESFSTDLIGALGGDKRISPVLDSLIAHGLLFDSIYSSGFRTDQGIVSVLNGWPATPFHSIIRSIDKCNQLPSLPRLMKEEGYHTAFYYGGESNFSNLNAYVMNQGFDRLVDKRSFDETVDHGQWGVHDGPVLMRQATDLDTMRTPFLSVIMTLSSHEPFDVPGPIRIPGDKAPDRFRNAAAYTDAMLGEYFRVVQAKPWYNNTLFILVADHSHKLPLKRNVLTPPGRHIPLLFFGPALRDSWEGHRVHKLGGHQDVPATLLPAMGMQDSSFRWSKDLLDQSSKPFAYLPYENYLTWISPAGWFIWNFERNTITVKSPGYRIKDNDPEAMFARAYMQTHFSDYRSIR